MSSASSRVWQAAKAATASTTTHGGPFRRPDYVPSFHAAGDRESRASTQETTQEARSQDPSASGTATSQRASGAEEASTGGGSEGSGDLLASPTVWSKGTTREALQAFMETRRQGK